MPAEGACEDLGGGVPEEPALCQGLPVPPASRVQEMMPALPGGQSWALWGLMPQDAGEEHAAIVCLQAESGATPHQSCVTRSAVTGEQSCHRHPSPADTVCCEGSKSHLDC